MVDERKEGSVFKPATTAPVPRTGEDLKDMFFRIRALFSECHRRWSVSGQWTRTPFRAFYRFGLVEELAVKPEVGAD
jgi:hypothetical protein